MLIALEIEALSEDGKEKKGTWNRYTSMVFYAQFLS
jgi:hypothetical protein